MIKAIIFDMGGVIFDLDTDASLKAFSEIGFTDILDYLDPCHQKGFLNDLEAGKIDEDEFYRQSFMHCKPGTTRQQVRDCLSKFITGIAPDKVTLLEELRKDYDLYALSNNNVVSVDICSKLVRDMGIPFEDTFKHMFFSYEMKMLKPSPEIYQATIAGIGCDPSEMLFIDDNQRNVDAAIKEGINAVLYKPGTDLRACVMSALQLYK